MDLTLDENALNYHVGSVPELAYSDRLAKVTDGSLATFVLVLA